MNHSRNITLRLPQILPGMAFVSDMNEVSILLGFDINMKTKY
jgi:hypothetical protein